MRGNLPGGISHAGGLASIDGDIVVADIQSVKAYDSETGQESWNYKNTFRVSDGSKYFSFNIITT